MPSSLTSFPEIAKKALTPIIDEDYDNESVVFPLLCDVQSEVPLFGTKGTSMGGMGEPSFRSDGAEIEFDQFGEGYVWYVKIQNISRGFKMAENEVAHLNDQLGESGLGDTMARLVKGWGASFQSKKDKHVAGLFMKGTLTAGSLQFFDGTHKGETDPYPKFIYDGLPFFDGAHTQKHGSSTYSNISTSNPLTTANLQTSWTTMTSTNAYDDRGNAIMVRPNVLVHPPALEFTAGTILNSAQLPGTANNDINLMNGRVTPISWRYLTDDATQWILGEAGKGIRVYDTGRPVLRVWFEERTREWCVSAESRFGVGVTNWRFWHSNDKADT